MLKAILPELGQGIDKATVSFWFLKEGDKVKEKDDLVELTTDKAAFNLPSPGTGTITEIFFREGETVNVGQVLAHIDEN
ncbi:MAG: lipoyl domain-containing protein [Candidatus Omnitrophica bacterium]|jgi:pyruvate/2-oxoglutarate dehydrogenase complex dihydrolipoamide acyltransferase (E2) component|nr:lipoyl domain-containing protein [Candidatus Omnitrophota bacterium]MDD5079133.1 lipoyl domain-containing protein [Candidatus Omnitrophota bacterium]